MVGAAFRLSVHGASGAVLVVVLVDGQLDARWLRARLAVVVAVVERRDQVALEFGDLVFDGGACVVGVDQAEQVA
jgi:hypothetical protein